MSGRTYTPVQFALEKNVVFLFGRLLFGTGGSVSLDTNNSKGTCAAWQNTPTFTGTVASGSATITSVSSFQGLFTGMVLGGVGVIGSGTFTIGTISAATGSVVIQNGAAALASGSNTFTGSGGQYILQFGTQAATRLDTYAKFFKFQASFDESTGSATGSLTQAQLAPAVGGGFVIANNSKQRTIPATTTSGSTDCSLTIQFGTGNGVNFVAANPAAGESVRYFVEFGNSTSI